MPVHAGELPTAGQGDEAVSVGRVVLGGRNEGRARATARGQHKGVGAEAEAGGCPEPSEQHEEVTVMFIVRVNAWRTR